MRNRNQNRELYIVRSLEGLGKRRTFLRRFNSDGMTALKLHGTDVRVPNTLFYREKILRLFEVLHLSH
jgi:hypothetical protein